MTQIVSYDTFRVMKACRDIEAANSGILEHVGRLRSDAQKVGKTLKKAGQLLEDALVEFSAVQQRLSDSQDEHHRIMRMVDQIMAESPVFQDILSTAAPVGPDGKDALDPPLPQRASGRVAQ